VELDELLRVTIAKICAIPVSEIDDDTRLDALGVDSLAVAEIIVEMEVELGVELPIDVLRQLDRVQTVGDVVTELRATMAGQSPEPTG